MQVTGRERVYTATSMAHHPPCCRSALLGGRKHSSVKTTWSDEPREHGINIINPSHGIALSLLSLIVNCRKWATMHHLCLEYWIMGNARELPSFIWSFKLIGSMMLEFQWAPATPRPYYILVKMAIRMLLWWKWWCQTAWVFPKLFCGYGCVTFCYSTSLLFFCSLRISKHLDPEQF